MSAPRRRPPSPLAHRPGEECASCRECPSCEGGRRETPRQYRVDKRGSEATGYACRKTCTGCEGSGVECPNLRHDMARPRDPLLIFAPNYREAQHIARELGLPPAPTVGGWRFLADEHPLRGRRSVRVCRSPRGYLHPRAWQIDDALRVIEATGEVEWVEVSL